MQPSTIRTLAEYIAEHRRRDRNHNRTISGSAFDTTLEDHTPGDERNRSGDGGRDQDASGQSGD
jgi:hypothetical protein